MARRNYELPVWLVFCSDLFMVCFCLFLTRMFKLNFNWEHIGAGLGFMICVALVFNAMLFFVFKSYASAITSANLKGASKLVAVNAVAAFFYLVLNVFFLRSGNYFTLQVVSINFFITSFMIILARLAIGHLFSHNSKNSQGAGTAIMR